MHYVFLNIKSPLTAVLLTSHMVCCAGKPIERVVYCLNKTCNENTKKANSTIE